MQQFLSLLFILRKLLGSKSLLVSNDGLSFSLFGSSDVFARIIFLVYLIGFDIFMARITVEDCLGYVENRFELVLVSSKRARQIAIEGKEPMVEEDKDKPTVLALREIAEGLIKPSILEEQEDNEPEDIGLEFTDDQVIEESGEPPSLT